MKSTDYLYDLLKKHPDEGWYIGRKRYTIGTSMRGGKWNYAVCSCFRDSLRIIGDYHFREEDAWEKFLTANYPKIMQKWRDREKGMV
jgi:hypothetical protein